MLWGLKDYTERFKKSTKVKTSLTFIQIQRIAVILTANLMLSSALPTHVAAQDKRTFTHFIDLRPGREDALLDIFKPLSEQFSQEFRALGTAYTAGEVLYQQKRYQDAARNFETVVTKAKR